MMEAPLFQLNQFLFLDQSPLTPLHSVMTAAVPGSPETVGSECTLQVK